MPDTRILHEEIDNFDADEVMEEVQEEETPETEEASEETLETEETIEEASEENIPDKFKGKSKEDIIKSYQELEKKLGERTTEVEVKQEKITPEEKNELIAELTEKIKDKDFSGMNAADFAKWVIEQAVEVSTKKTLSTIEEQTRLRIETQKEIEEAVKEYPQLKSDKNFKELTIALIEAATARGETLSLKDAAKKVALSFKLKENEEKVKKTPTESTDGAAGTKPDDEAERIRQGILGAGGTNTFGGM